MKKYDLTGMKFGKWNVLSFYGMSESRDSLYLCKCDCGTEKPVKGYYLKNGYSEQCVACGHESQKIKGRKVPHAFWNSLQNNAQKRKIELKLEIDAVALLLETQNYCCAISGMPIQFAKTETQHLNGETTASIDRIDSNGIYEPSNIQLVHKTVNFMKHTLRDEEFVEICKCVVDHHRENKSE